MAEREGSSTNAEETKWSKTTGEVVRAMEDWSRMVHGGRSLGWHTLDLEREEQKVQAERQL